MQKNSNKSLLPTHKSYSYPFEGFIWKILISKTEPILLLELRNDSTRQASFAAIDLRKQKLNWHQEKLSEKWWIGMLRTEGKYVILHGYQNLKTPAHQKIFTFDISNGNLLWKNEAYRAIECYPEGILAQDPASESEELFLLDYKSGKQIKKIKEADFDVQITKLDIIKPGKYSDENVYFSKLADFVKITTTLEALKAIEYVETAKGGTVLSFYIQEEEKLVNYILVCDEEGNVVLLDKMNEGLQTAAPETFFLYKQYLIYIKNRKELVIFELD